MVWLIVTIIAVLVVLIVLILNAPEYEEQADGTMKRILPRDNSAGLPE